MNGTRRKTEDGHPGGGSSHQDHLGASIQTGLKRTSATLVGFYSTSDQGVFTHHDSTTHIHCVLASPLSSGHVDHVLIPAGATIKFPALGIGAGEKPRNHSTH